MQKKLTNHLKSLGSSLFDTDDDDDIYEVSNEPSNKMKLGVLIREHRSMSAK